MNIRPYLLTAALLAASATARAQPPPPGGPGPFPHNPPPPPQGDMMMENFFPPELVMHNQKAIGLKEDQQAAIKTEMQKMMQRVTEMQWEQSAAAETMASLVKQERVDEKQVLAQLDKLLSIENQIKRAHFALLIKLKNTLTPEQQAQLREMKKQARPRPQGPPMGRDGPEGQNAPSPPPFEAPPR